MRSIGRSPASSMTIKWSPNCISGPFAILEQEDSILEQGETSILAKIFWATRCFFALNFFLQIVIAPKCLLKPSKMSFNQIGILYDKRWGLLNEAVCSK